MSFKKDLILLLKPYYSINILLSLSYILCKKVPFVCGILFPGSYPQCELDTRESEILFFLLIVVMMKTKKSGSVTMINYLTSSFIYNKVANMILWFYADVRMGIIFSVICIFFAMVFPEPTYSGPDKVVYFRTAAGLEEQLERDRRVTWLVVFYTAWNPACVTFAPIFAELSAEYGLENLKFGKIDVGRYPDAAKKYNVNDSSMSRQLPTLILFKDGKEVTRRPGFDNKGKVIKFFFSGDNVKASFDLNNLYNECKSNPLKKRKPLTERTEMTETVNNHVKSE
ncbi:thioredoxin-related transmembrane protein 2 homolog [Schistocerca gregaria]|uniref:thioredoxin-related transmembrane protein 2 homolog n=1 Tax=Schistocerca gregaria TaxID=7010 RepID=UPI00211E994F|nr:thioredoxin-related transmembrane protein 2 homolog [Schistocerca gregaria]